MNRAGNTLLTVLVTSSLMAFVAMAFVSMFKSQTKATRSIAAHGGVTDLSHALDALFGSPQCATTGSYLNGGSPASVSVSGSTYSLAVDTIKFASGAVAITALPDPSIAAMIRPYTIPALTWIGLGGSGTYGPGFRYPFELKVRFDSSDGPPALPFRKFVTVYTDGSNQVQGACFSASPSTSKIVYSGLTNVYWLNGQTNSNRYPVTFPGPCSNPVIVTQTIWDSICCQVGSAVGICVNENTTTSEDLLSRAYNITSTGFEVALSTPSPVCVGAPGCVVGTPCGGTSPAYPVAWIATCDAP